MHSGPICKEGKFKCVCFIGGDGQRIPLTIVQYTFFDGIAVPVRMAPQGNCRKASRPYFCTQTSTLESMKENLPSVPPKQIVCKSYEKVGGVLQMKSCSEVARNLRQVYNKKSYQGSTSNLTLNCEKDLLYDLLEQHYSSEKNFVRSVSLLIFLAFVLKQFKANSSESLNNLLKRRVDFKRREWPQFNKVLKALSEEQQAEFEKAAFGGEVKGGPIFGRGVLENTPIPLFEQPLSSSPMGVFSRDYGTYKTY